MSGWTFQLPQIPERPVGILTWGYSQHLFALYVEFFSTLCSQNDSLQTSRTAVWSPHVGQRCHLNPQAPPESQQSCTARQGHASPMLRQTMRPPVRFQARLTLCQRWKRAFPSARETRGVSGNAKDHTGSLCASGMCKCNQHIYVNLRFAFMHLDALSVYMLWKRPTVCAEYSQEEHTIKKIALCYKIHITSVNKLKCIWSVHLTWLFYQVQHLCINDSYFCYCRSDALFSSVGPENSHIYRPEDQEWLVSCQTGGKHLETTQNDPKKTPPSSHSLKKNFVMEKNTNYRENL